jgi:hypothetical protein
MAEVNAAAETAHVAAIARVTRAVAIGAFAIVADIA